MKINILLISKLESALNTIRELLKDDDFVVIGDSLGGSHALEKIENTSPDILIMTLSAGDLDVLNLAERIIMHRPRTFVILLVDSLDINLIQKAIRVGAHNITELPASAKEFAEYIKSVYNSESIRINSLTEKQNISWMSRVITVFGSKGGLGKTTIATNLAVKLAGYSKKVALVDLDLQFGDIHLFMDIEPKDTIVELVQEVFTPNIDSLRSYMVVHPSGVHVLCAPKSPEYAEIVTPEKIQSLLSLMRSYYDYVIIDTPPIFNEVTITALESSSTILFVTGLDISILKNTKIALSLLESLQQKDKVKIIVNRNTDIKSITLHDVQRITGCPIWAKIPSDYNVAVSALNSGVPFTIGAPHSRLSQSLSEVAKLLLVENGDYGGKLADLDGKQKSR